MIIAQVLIALTVIMMLTIPLWVPTICLWGEEEVIRQSTSLRR